MSVRVFIVGVGLISPLGAGFARNRAALEQGRTGIAPLSLFPTPHRAPLPVGEVRDLPRDNGLPRTHVLAGLAAAEALRGARQQPDAVVLGAVTGGMPVTEVLLKDGVRDPRRYRHHANGSVAEYVAGEIGCTGTVLTVSTACSSGTAALKLALEMLRSGRSACALAGGVDALCRMTYYGFNALQLVDPEGARPLDRSRRGMTVAEGAALLLLVAGEEAPDHALAEILGAGLSCDAYHPAAPRPDGSGACRAMQDALIDAGVAPSGIDYVHLHGTGTVDNDLAEARALHDLFGGRMPSLSSTKGATGHALGAAGALGAAISVMSIGAGLVPASSGCRVPDPELNLHPVTAPLRVKVDTVLSNAFGFGGNNAALVTGRPGKSPPRREVRREDFFTILGSACLTGAGDASSSLERLREGKPVLGLMPPEAMAAHLPPRDLRRLKRLSRAVQSLALAAHAAAAAPAAIASVFFGTGWGPLSEMHDFLMKLFDSNEQFTSPTDFVGSVHNAAAGQVAIRFNAQGPNVTMTGGDCSFEQALMGAVLLPPDPGASCLLIAADEDHPVLSRRFDPSAALSDVPSDGGAAFCLDRGTAGRGPKLFPALLRYARGDLRAVDAMVDTLGGKAAIESRYGAVFAGIPLAQREIGRRQLDGFLSLAGFTGGVVDYRRWTGEYAAASAVAACCAARFVAEGIIPILPGHSSAGPLHGKGILLVGLGDFITAVGILP